MKKTILFSICLLIVLFSFQTAYAFPLSTSSLDDTDLTYDKNFVFTSPEFTLRIVPIVSYNSIESKLSASAEKITPIIKYQNDRWKYGLDIDFPALIDASKLDYIKFRLESKEINWKEAKIDGQQIVYGDWIFDFSDLNTFDLTIKDTQTVEVVIKGMKKIFLDPTIKSGLAAASKAFLNRGDAVARFSDNNVAIFGALKDGDCAGAGSSTDCIVMWHSTDDGATFTDYNLLVFDGSPYSASTNPKNIIVDYNADNGFIALAFFNYLGDDQIDLLYSDVDDDNIFDSADWEYIESGILTSGDIEDDFDADFNKNHYCVVARRGIAPPNEVGFRCVNYVDENVSDLTKWSKETGNAIDSATVDYTGAAMAVDSSGDFYVVVTVVDGNAWITKRTDGSWHDPVDITTGKGGGDLAVGIDIDINANDGVWLSYESPMYNYRKYTISNCNANDYNCMQASNWSKAKLISDDATADAKLGTIATDWNGNIYFADSNKVTFMYKVLYDINAAQSESIGFFATTNQAGVLAITVNDIYGKLDIVYTVGDTEIDFNSFDTVAGAITGEAAPSPTAPDVNVVIPNGGEEWTDGNHLIVFTVQDDDSNYITAKLYYSTSAGGWENHIVDLNLFWIGENPTVDANCSDVDFSNDTNCFYDWDVDDITYNVSYYLDVNVVDDDGNFSTDSSDSNFTIGTPAGTIDANFSYTIPSALDILGGTTNTSTDLTDTSILTDANAEAWKWYANGDVNSTDQNITLTFYSPGDHNVCLWIVVEDASDTNHEDMQCHTITIETYPQNLDFTTSPHEAGLVSWNFDFNATADNDANVTSWVWDFNDGTKLSGQDLNYTFATSGDYNVCITATTPTDLNATVCKTVGPYLLVVKIPLNEKDLAQITPFAVRIESIEETASVQDLNAISVDANFYLTTVGTYRIKVWDTNGDFFPRKYLLTVSSGTYEYEIQPYLTDELYTLFYVYDNYSGTPISDVRIRITKNISNLGVQTVEEMFTDSSGVASASFVIGDTYTVDFNYQNELIFTATITPSSTDAFYVYLEITEIVVIGEVIITKVIVDFLPPEGSIYNPDSNILDFNQTISIENGTISLINIKLINDDNTLYDTNFTSGVADGGFYQQLFDSNSILQEYPISVIVSVTTTDGEIYVKTATYFLVFPPDWGTLEQNLKLLIDHLNDPLGAENKFVTSLIAVFFAMMVVGVATTKTALNYSGTALLGMAVLGFFTAINWMNPYLFMLAAFAVFAVWMFKR